MVATILLVDDEPAALTHITRWLSREGCAVRVAENGVQALDQARRQRPDLVLIDLMLPDMDAFSICEELRRFPATAEVPIVIMTGLAAEFTRVPEYARRANAFLCKPCPPEELIRTVEEVLREHSKATTKEKSKENPKSALAPLKLRPQSVA